MLVVLIFSVPAVSVTFTNYNRFLQGSSKDNNNATIQTIEPIDPPTTSASKFILIEVYTDDNSNTDFTVTPNNEPTNNLTE